MEVHCHEDSDNIIIYMYVIYNLYMYAHANIHIHTHIKFSASIGAFWEILLRVSQRPSCLLLPNLALALGGATRPCGLPGLDPAFAALAHLLLAV
jgi:hypothetical protein